MKTDSKECILLEINFLLHFIGLSALDWGGRFPHCVVLTLPTLLDLCGCCEILTSLMVIAVRSSLASCAFPSTSRATRT